MYTRLYCKKLCLNKPNLYWAVAKLIEIEIIENEKWVRNISTI